MKDQHSDSLDHHLVLVTGPSGAGRSTATKILEDLGFESIDNLPLSLLPRLLDGPPLARPMAIGIDVRNRDFGVNAMLDVMRGLADNPRILLDILYLDCHSDVLLRRYSETRRRHPLAAETAPDIGITREMEMLVPIRSNATVLVDTTNLTPHDLKAELKKLFDPEDENKMAVLIESFSYKRGLPRGLDMAFDCRFLRNPHWEPKLRTNTGQDQEVQDYVAKDPLYSSFYDQVEGLITTLLPAFRAEGKSHLTIGFGCTGGQHRSVAMAEQIANGLAKAGWPASKRHRELERRTRSAPSVGSGMNT